MEVKIEIPDNCELIKEGDSYIVREKVSKPKSWEEFCKNFPTKPEECYIDADSNIIDGSDWEVFTRKSQDKNLCINQEEAEAFLALIQLRQLRKAWIGDWEQPTSFTETTAITYNIDNKKLVVESEHYWTLLPLFFPTKKMAEEFLECFKDLCETAKILL